MFAAVAACLLFCPKAQALSGSVYAGALERCYRHPLTGAIEDSGGEAGYATGQGMVEGCLSKKTMLEVTDGGKCFLTIRLSLIDYTKDRDFMVQKWGAKKWSKTQFAVAKKSKGKGETAYDYCISVPSAKSIVRITMFVKPIGRKVVGYFYPRDLKLGKQTGMTPKIVTEKSEGKSRKTLETGTTKEGGDALPNASSGEGVPEAGASTGGARGLTLSVADESGGDGGSVQQAANLADAGIASFASSDAGRWVLGAACALVLACLVLVLRRHRKRRAASDSDDYAESYAESLSGVAGRGRGGRP